MADITIVNGVYKPTYNWGAPSCGNGEEENDRPMRSFSVFLKNVRRSQWAKRASIFLGPKKIGSGCPSWSLFFPVELKPVTRRTLQTILPRLITTMSNWVSNNGIVYYLYSKLPVNLWCMWAWLLINFHASSKGRPFMDWGQGRFYRKSWSWRVLTSVLTIWLSFL
jgi:hypothetical protein